VAYHGSKQLGFGKSKDELYFRYTSEGIALNELLVRRVKPGIFLEIGVERP
jgi:hypothetical protein